MTDLHTHILPGVDDGAQSVEEALTMLCTQMQQGVRTVALTPHFYRNKEHVAAFLARREVAWSQLREKIKDDPGYPRLILGAEVAWMPNMAEWPDLEALCYQGTKVLLVELPVDSWTDDVFGQLSSLVNCRGVVPMIAHLERYCRTQRKKNVERLLEMGYPVQVSAEALFLAFRQKAALNLLENYDGLLISDCHNLSDRKPNLDQAIKKLERKLGRQAAWQIAALTDDALADWLF